MVTKDRISSTTQTLQLAVVLLAVPLLQHLRWLLLRPLHANVMIARQPHLPPSASASGKRTTLLTESHLPMRRSARSSRSQTAADQHLLTLFHHLRLHVTARTPRQMLDESMMAITPLKLLTTLHRFPR